ncbi:hypothetical protein [Rhizorhabdus wittichii]|uniref:hypothetical protein n=1 Tax=Rhizorhabdus wittichii TaxID=160791 RepID=UPI0012FD6338|nr:hypothetical protein [Rhizorhabdus wittichii]
MKKLLAFDHVTFAFICASTIFSMMVRAGLSDALKWFAAGTFYSFYNGYILSADREYVISLLGKRVGIILYIFAIFGALVIIILPEYFL